MYPSLFKDQILLKKLDLSKNKINIIQKETFNGLAKLEFLDLSSNEIEKVEDSVFGYLLGLKELDLNYNKISKLGGNIFVGPGQLSILNLAGNELSLTEKSFQYLNILSTLDLSGTNISAIPDRSFSHLPSLRKLRLDKNQIIQINEDTFTGLKQLQTLSISWNAKLREIDSKAFQQNQQLSKIEISHNMKLSVLPKQLFKKLSNLTNLDLSHNNLSYVDLPQNKSWDSLLLSDNPWTCDCDLMSVHLATKSITCHQPPGVSLSSVIQSLNCQDDNNNDNDNNKTLIIVVGVVVPFIVVAVVVVAVCCIMKKMGKSCDEEMGLTVNEDKKDEDVEEGGKLMPSKREEEQIELGKNEVRISVDNDKKDQNVTDEKTKKIVQLKKPFENVIGNGRRKVLIIGETGTGKSTLCNVISGLPHNAKVFPVSAEAVSCTQETQLTDVYFNGQHDKPISLIDTIGFEDPKNDTDAVVIADLVTKLHNRVDYVNTFILAVNGQSPRLDGSLLGMIKIFEAMFGPGFWEQTIVVFTRLRMDKKSLKRRNKASGKSDEELAKNYIQTVEDEFSFGKGLDYLIMDACFDKEDDDEKRAFEEASERLWEKIKNAGRLQTENVRMVESEYKQLKREIEKKEKAMKEEMERFKAGLGRPFNRYSYLDLCELHILYELFKKQFMDPSQSPNFTTLSAFFVCPLLPMNY